MATTAGTYKGGTTTGSAFLIYAELDTGDSLKIQPSSGIWTVQNIMCTAKISYAYYNDSFTTTFYTEPDTGACSTLMCHFPCQNDCYLLLTNQSGADDKYIVVTGIVEA